MSEQEREALLKTLHHHPQPYVRERCAAMLKIAEGKSPHWVAKHGLLVERDPDSVYQWLTWYEQEGLRDLIMHQHGGSDRRYL